MLNCQTFHPFTCDIDRIQTCNIHTPVAKYFHVSKDPVSVLASSQPPLLEADFEHDKQRKPSSKAHRQSTDTFPYWGERLLENSGSTARDHLSNIRTYLAWVRTALAAVGKVNCLFVREIVSVPKPFSSSHHCFRLFSCL